MGCRYSLLPHIEERDGHFSPLPARRGRADLRTGSAGPLQGRLLWVFQILHDGQLPIAVLVSFLSSNASEKSIERR